MPKENLGRVLVNLAMEKVAEARSPDPAQAASYVVHWYANPAGRWVVVYLRAEPPLTCIVAYGDEFRIATVDQPPEIDI